VEDDPPPPPLWPAAFSSKNSNLRHRYMPDRCGTGGSGSGGIRGSAAEAGRGRDRRSRGQMRVDRVPTLRVASRGAVGCLRRCVTAGFYCGAEEGDEVGSCRWICGGEWEQGRRI
jgi:hypothetical protein